MKDRDLDPPFEEELTPEQKALNEVLESIGETEARENYLKELWDNEYINKRT